MSKKNIKTIKCTDDLGDERSRSLVTGNIMLIISLISL